jgi:hypothetical protein
MWLLDANLDVHLAGLMRSLGTECDTAENRGWKALPNGDLLTAAAESGFDVLLTRDQLFAESASRAWRKFPTIGVVIVTLPPLPSPRYLEAFATAWTASTIEPERGTIVLWP